MSTGDRWHSAISMQFFCLIWKEKTGQKDILVLIIVLSHKSWSKKHVSGRTSFRKIIDDYFIDNDIVNRKQRSNYDKIDRGVFRFST